MKPRLMFRQEGEFWNVYFGTGPQHSMLLGSIRMGLVVDRPKAKDAFMKIFSDALGRAIEDLTGQTPDMNLEIAPENERSGSA